MTTPREDQEARSNNITSLLLETLRSEKGLVIEVGTLPVRWDLTSLLQFSELLLLFKAADGSEFVIALRANVELAAFSWRGFICKA